MNSNEIFSQLRSEAYFSYAMNLHSFHLGLLIVIPISADGLMNYLDIPMLTNVASVASYRG